MAALSSRSGPRTWIFFGPPDARDVRPNSPTLLDEFQPAVRRFIEGPSPQTPRLPCSTASAQWPHWRRVEPLLNSNADADEHAREPAQNLADHLEDSFLAFAGESQPSSLLSSSLASSLRSSLGSQTGSPAQLPAHLGLSDLKSVPSATTIQRASPATITLNLLCCVLSLSPPRLVTPRFRHGVPVQLTELLVADDTRTGFSVTFWGETDALRNVRRGALVALSNVAVHVWRGAVYGRSLNERVCRARTGVWVVGEDGLDVSEGVREKLERLRRWKARFLNVGAGEGEGRARGQGVERMAVHESLPPDTQ